MLRNVDIIDEKYRYDGKLGVEYSSEKSTFRLFSPLSNKVELLLNDEVLEMNKNDNGVYELEVTRNLDESSYMYKVYFDNIVYTTLDPYAISCNANGEKGYIIDLDKTNPLNFKRMSSFENILDTVIYELHIRDFTLDAKNKGKYLGVVEEKQLNYLKKLGVTHIQILPFYDYSSDSVDELNPDLRYNWGYDPVNYNIPEGSYSTNPQDPYNRIKELKEMIKVLHENGFRVIMDVVYNHVFDAMAHSLWKTLENYAFRFYENGEFSNGTGCGNDVASEKYMIRKYIVDSIKYWASEYKLDGFRFDLMGILDVETMNEIRKELNKIDDSIIILGEGWDLNTNLNKELKANQYNAYKMPNISFFSDDMRDSLRGSTFEKLERGFVNNGTVDKRLLNSIKGGINLRGYISPNQVIQYIEAHDNNTVFDHFEITNSESSLDERIRMQAIATSIVLCSQGIPFIHAGQEFFRTKFGIENSYKSSDEINKFDFERAQKYQEYVNYFSDLIKYRSSNDLFKLGNFDVIEEKIDIIRFDYESLIFSIDNKLLIAVNVSKDTKSFNIPDNYKGNYRVIFENFRKNETNKTILLDNILMQGLEFILLEKIEIFENGIDF
ncbi:type I pullulanase [Pseudostreptobacillus hongkongensis]|uniref:type I pullulanase n=1 Tax=Pseudostreptobacillus hongkongensis TaxID=1162717 RepID=UPI0028D43AAC|nr:type I pullulanase [Pseudostreptobacillus hongkongensis]